MFNCCPMAAEIASLLTWLESTPSASMLHFMTCRQILILHDVDISSSRGNGCSRKAKYIDQQHAGRSEAHHWLAGQHAENSL